MKIGSQRCRLLLGVYKLISLRQTYGQDSDQRLRPRSRGALLGVSWAARWLQLMDSSGGVAGWPVREKNKRMLVGKQLNFWVYQFKMEFNTTTGRTAGWNRAPSSGSHRTVCGEWPTVWRRSKDRMARSSGLRKRFAHKPHKLSSTNYC